MRYTYSHWLSQQRHGIDGAMLFEVKYIHLLNEEKDSWGENMNEIMQNIKN